MTKVRPPIWISCLARSSNLAGYLFFREYKKELILQGFFFRLSICSSWLEVRDAKKASSWWTHAIRFHFECFEGNSEASFTLDSIFVISISGKKKSRVMFNQGMIKNRVPFYWFNVAILHLVWANYYQIVFRFLTRDNVKVCMANRDWFWGKTWLMIAFFWGGGGIYKAIRIYETIIYFSHWTQWNRNAKFLFQSRKKNANILTSQERHLARHHAFQAMKNNC